MEFEPDGESAMNIPRVPSFVNPSNRITPSLFNEKQ